MNDTQTALEQLSWDAEIAVGFVIDNIVNLVRVVRDECDTGEPDTGKVEACCAAAIMMGEKAHKDFFDFLEDVKKLIDT